MSGVADPSRRALPPILRSVFGATFFIRFGFGITLSVFVDYVAGAATNPLLSQGAVYGTVGLIVALAPIGEFSTVLFSGMAADRFGRIRVLVIGMAVASVALALSSLTREPAVLGGLQLAFGVASGAILASSLAVVAQESGTSERGLEMGRFDAMNLLGWILGFAVGLAALGVLGSSSVPQLAWVLRGGALVVAVGIAVVLLWSRGYRESVAPDAFRFARLQAAIARRDVLLVTLPWLVIYLLIGTALTFLGRASESVSISPTYVALAIAAGGLLLLLTQPYYGRLADRYGRMRLMVVGTAGFVGVLVGAALLSAYGPLPGLLAVIGVSAIPALAYGPAALAALADLSRSMNRATTMAIYTLSISVGTAIGILGSTQLVSAFGSTGLYVFFGVVATALILLAVGRYVYLQSSGPETAGAPVTTRAR